MQINHNLSALKANFHLLRNESSLTKSIERLTSGSKISKSGDDPAGMAISRKMKAQIEGLNQASQNAQDGVSIVQSADGALAEVTSMLQRMRELSVQAANDTNGVQDVEAIQKEMDALGTEIDRISRDTDYNKKSLLDGSMDQRGYTDIKGVKVKTFSTTVSAGDYELVITGDAKQAIVVGNTGAAGATVTDAQAGSISINGMAVSIKEGETATEVFAKIRDAAKMAQVNVGVPKNQPPDIKQGADGADEEYANYVLDDSTNYTFSKGLLFVSEDYGSSSEVSISCDNSNLAALLGIPTTIKTQGVDVKVDFGTARVGFDNTATILTDGNKITVTDRNGFKLEVNSTPGLLEAKYKPDGTQDIAAKTNQKVKLDIMDVGTMILQIGDKENQNMSVKIPEVSLKSLEIDNLSVLNSFCAGKSITKIDNAIARVSEIRAQVGAYQNRLDHAVASLDVTEENMTGAMSRLVDVDVAEEMSVYTQHSILVQAGTSILAQANDLPNTMLQLLQ